LRKNSADLDEIIENVKLICSNSNLNTRKKILTILPKNWSIKKISEMCGVSQHIASQSKNLKSNFGVFSDPPPQNKGHVLSPETIENFTCMRIPRLDRGPDEET